MYFNAVVCAINESHADIKIYFGDVHNVFAFQTLVTCRSGIYSGILFEFLYEKL